MATPSIACIGIIGKHDNPLHIALFPPHTSTPSAHLEFSFLLNASLDIFDTRARDRNCVDQDLGMLQAVDERLSIWGWETGTGTRFAVVVDAWGNCGNKGARGLLDGDLKGALKALQTAYIRLLQNPFYVPDEHTPMAVASGRGKGGQITSKRFIEEVKRIGEIWKPGMSKLFGNYRFFENIPKALRPFINMQITVQMLDKSITLFKVRSTITIASLKAKFEPWQPMKGRALLHHNVQLDDRATLCSVPGIMDGTILRVDKQAPPMKNKTTGKKRVMSGPVRSAVDEDVVESIERSGDNEETSSENEMQILRSKRKRPSRTWAATVEDFIDGYNTANAPQRKALVPGEMSEDSFNMADTDLSNSTMALHIAKKEKKKSKAREQADILAPEARKLGHRVHSLKSTFAPPPANPVERPTASAHVPKSTEGLSSHQDVMEYDDATFLAGINAAAAETDRLPLHYEARAEEHVSVRRCGACGRACGCGGDPLAMSNSVAPVVARIRGQEAASTKSNINGYLITERNSTSQRTESSWTGM
ncbi:MAG: hypothetical protein Q9175_006746 [Cornicularia normoerica]